MQNHVDAAIVWVVVVLVIAFEACHLTKVPASASASAPANISAAAAAVLATVWYTANAAAILVLSVLVAAF